MRLVLALACGSCDLCIHNTREQEAGQRLSIVEGHM
jgi:hypothetical protein